MTRPVFDGSADDMVQVRRAAALQLAVDAYKDDKSYRKQTVPDATAADVRADRIVAAAEKFDAFLRNGGQAPGD